MRILVVFGFNLNYVVEIVFVFILRLFFNDTN